MPRRRATPRSGASALESGGDSGWPGTDWIEDIVLRQAGPTVYDGWVAGTTKWTDPAIKAAWSTFGDAVANAYNTPAGYVNATNFGKAANPMFASPAGCLLHHQASFITDFFKNEAKAQPADYGFFPFPDIDPAYAGSITGGGDLFGMFNDTPQARSLIQYMLTPEAQQIWVERGGFISANKNVPLDAYPDPASKASAEILANAKTFRFDGSDLMPNAMNKAFFQGDRRVRPESGQPRLHPGKPGHRAGGRLHPVGSATPERRPAERPPLDTRREGWACSRICSVTGWLPRPSSSSWYRWS